MPVETLAPLPASNSAVAVPVPAPTVQEVLCSIAADAVAAAGEYLRDTEVPHGGE
jgi:hypothetical protein